MAFDAKSNFGFGLVAIAPSPATTGTTFSMTNAEAALMPDPSVANYNLTIWQNNKRPMGSNAEIIRVTARGAANSGGAGFTQFTITRQQEGTSARTIVSGDFVGNNMTKKWFDDVETSITQKTTITVGTSVGADYVADGVSDDVEIQAALDATNTKGGGTVFIKKGIYNLSNTLTISSNTTLVGESMGSTTLRMGAALNKTVIQNRNKSSSSVIDSFIVIKNIRIDGQGALQTSSGGGLSFGGIQDCTFQDIYIDYVYNHNFFVVAQSGTSKSGTLSVTNGSQTVTGSGTSFTSDVTPGSILRITLTSGSDEFLRVKSVTSDTSLILDRQWGWSSETGKTFKVVQPNSRNVLNRVTMAGNNIDDNSGYGVFDDSEITNCISFGATGYGFGLDHCNNVRLVNNLAYNNTNSGFGLETIGHSTISGNLAYKNGTGFNLLSGSYRNVVSSNISRYNTDKGFSVVYNVNTFPAANSNTLNSNQAFGNTNDGIYVAGVFRTVVSDNQCYNNGRAGITLSTVSGIPSNTTMISTNQCYDNQDVKTQQYGIYIFSANNTTLLGNVALDADATVKGIFDGGSKTSNLDGGNSFNVKAFGAVGDGTTNDSSSIQSAINAVVNAGGGVVLIPKGKYLINTSVTITGPNVTILGEGTGKTTLLAGYDGQSTLSSGTGRPGLISFFHTSNPTNNCFVESLSIDLQFKATSGISFFACNVRNTTSNVGISDVEIYHRGIDHAGDMAPIVIHGGLSTDTWKGIFDLVRIKDVYIHDGLPTQISDQVGYSILVRANYMSNVLFDNVTFQNTHGHTVEITSDVIRSNSNWEFRGCNFINTIGYDSNYQIRADIHDGSRTGFSSIRLIDCFFDCCYVPHDVLQRSDTLGNTVINYQLIEIFNSYDVLIDSCTFKNFQIVSGLGYSFPITNEDVNVVWSNNKFLNGCQFGDLDGTIATKFVNNVFVNIQRPGLFGGYGLHSPTVYEGNWIINCGYDPHRNEIDSDKAIFNLSEGGNTVINNVIYNDNPAIANGQYYVFREKYSSGEDLLGNQYPNVYSNNHVIGLPPKIAVFALNGKFRHVIKDNSGLPEDTIKNKVDVSNNLVDSSLNPTDVVSGNYTREGLLTNDLQDLGSLSGTVTINPVDGRKFKVVATGSLTFAIANGNSSDCKIIIEVTQDTTGGRTITLPSNAKVSGSTFIASTAANATDRLELEWNGAYFVETGRVMNIGQSSPSTAKLGGLLATINM
jgi:parallel beta-helix repeat protein